MRSCKAGAIFGSPYCRARRVGGRGPPSRKGPVPRRGGIAPPVACGRVGRGWRARPFARDAQKFGERGWEAKKFWVLPPPPYRRKNGKNSFFSILVDFAPHNFAQVRPCPSFIPCGSCRNTETEAHPDTLVGTADGTTPSKKYTIHNVCTKFDLF